MKFNTINLYKHFCEMIVNPSGVDGAERDLVRKNAIKAKADMEKHFKNSKKYKDDAEVQALLKPKEVKKDDERRNKSA